MNFKGNESGPVSRKTAKEWINNYYESESAKETGKTVIKAHFFGKEKIQKLLDEKDCVGIRIYYGLDDKGDQILLLVGANGEMEDILPADMTSEAEDGPMILDDSFPCPPYCSKSSF